MTDFDFISTCPCLPLCACSAQRGSSARGLFTLLGEPRSTAKDSMMTDNSYLPIDILIVY